MTVLPAPSSEALEPMHRATRWAWQAIADRRVITTHGAKAATVLAAAAAHADLALTADHGYDATHTIELAGMTGLDLALAALYARRLVDAGLLCSVGDGRWRIPEQAFAEPSREPCAYAPAGRGYLLPWDTLEPEHDHTACLDTDDDAADDESECPGHESLRGDAMGVSVFCDGTCV